jgi:hypothetical protein
MEDRMTRTEVTHAGPTTTKPRIHTCIDIGLPLGLHRMHLFPDRALHIKLCRNRS